MTYSFKSARCYIWLKLPFEFIVYLNWLVKQYCLLLLDVWILTNTTNFPGNIVAQILQECVQWLHFKRFAWQSLSHCSNYSFLEGTCKYLPCSRHVRRHVALSWHSCLSQLCSSYSLIRNSTQSLWKNNIAWLDKQKQRQRPDSFDSCQQV